MSYNKKPVTGSRFGQEAVCVARHKVYILSIRRQLDTVLILATCLHVKKSELKRRRRLKQRIWIAALGSRSLTTTTPLDPTLVLRNQTQQKCTASLRQEVLVNARFKGKVTLCQKP
jgi:hypothetical protein